MYCTHVCCCVLVLVGLLVTVGGVERNVEFEREVSERMRQRWMNINYSTYQHAGITEAQRKWFSSLVDDTSGSRVIRKELRTLSTEEWDSYVDAVWAAKHAYPDVNSTNSEYDVFVQQHLFVFSPGAHTGAGFLPWHREFLLRYEAMLRTHGLVGGLPYWDPTLDSYLHDPYSSMAWSELFFGEARGPVENGPFALFPIVERCIANPAEGFVGSKTLERKFENATFTKSAFYNDEDVELFFSKTRFEELCRTSFDEFEGRHDMGHVSISGQMGDVNCSPSDPLFFIYHAYMDYLWEVFRNSYQQTPLDVEYPQEDNGGSLHHPDSVMRPFEPLVNLDGLSMAYTSHYYGYSPSPGKCSHPSDCGSPYLTCDTSRGRCISRVRPGFACSDDDSAIIEQCYGSCVQGVCVPS